MILKMPNALSLIEHKKFLFFYFLLAILLSCSNVQKRDKPENLLSKDQMVEIYTDMLLLDAVKRSVSKSFESYNLEASEHIYNKFKIDSATLTNNMRYYNLDFEANAEIYKRVNENLENKREFIDSIVQNRDSIQKIEQQKKLKVKDSLSLIDKEPIVFKSN